MCNKATVAATFASSQNPGPYSPPEDRHKVSPNLRAELDRDHNFFKPRVLEREKAVRKLLTKTFAFLCNTGRVDTS